MTVRFAVMPFRASKLWKVVLVIESSRASGRSLLRGISAYERHRGPWAFYWEPGGFENVSRNLKNLDADGIILRDVEGLEEVLHHDIPTIVIGHRRREVRGFTNVVTDSKSTARLAAEHLIDCGFQSFGFVGYDGNPWSDGRRDEFMSHLSKGGFSPALFGSVALAPWKAEQPQLAAWLKSLPRPIGIMACNDDRAQNVSEACKIAGLRVPDDVGIVGADNDELVCELSHPPVSSVAINFERAGFEAARELHRLMRHPKRSRPRNILVEASHVVPRQSTDVLFMDDMAISRGIRFIRQNCRRQIGVSDVAQAAGLSRRVLEKRFRGVLRRSVLSEIRHARVEQIARMLVETNQSVSEIALATGFPGVEHLARYFRREKQMTPLNYRRAYGHK